MAYNLKDGFIRTVGMGKPGSSGASRERFNISRVALSYPMLTLSFWLAIVVAGLLAFSSLKYALFPDVTFPVIVVNVSAPLTSALETEAKVTKPIEQQLKSLEGLDDIDSSSYPGQAAVVLSFLVGTNLEQSTQQVETALQQVTLPQGATSKIIPLNLNESAAISYAIESSRQNLQQLTQVANEQIMPAIAKLPGVLKVNLLGAPVKATLPKPNDKTLPGQGATLVRFNRKDALAIQVVKQGNANTLEVVDRVEQAVAQLRTALPDVKLTLAATQAEYIRKATHSTIEALIEAIALSIIVIFPFLWNWRATLISALAIPMSLLGTFIVMAWFGFNLETITLLALALVIGSVVDDAIVDVENILRHIELGESPRQAAHSATDEIGLTVTAATLTAVAVFLPIGLMGGVIGQFFKPFGITVSAAMLMSMLIARTLSPVLSVYWLKASDRIGSRQESRGWLNFAAGYRNLLHWSLQHRRIVLAIALLSFLAGVALIPLIPKGFIPKLDRGEFNITYTAPLPKIPSNLPTNLSAGGMPGANSPETLPSALSSVPANAAQGTDPAQAEALRQLAQFNPWQDSLEVAQQLEAVVLQSPQVESVFTVAGSRGGEPNKGLLYVKLQGDRTVSTAEVQDQLRADLPKLEGVSTSVEDIQFVDTGGQKPLKLALQGENLESLSQAAQAVKNRVQQLPGFADVSVTGILNPQNQPLQIERSNGQRVAYLTANLGKNLNLGDATDQVVAEANQLLPPDVSLRLGGDSARLELIFRSFGSTLLLSALCILLVLAWLSHSWIDPLVIGLSLPLALVGAMLALLVTKSDFGMISLIGFVFLLGLANKNAILLVDYINQLRQAGLDRTEAILQAGPIRLRPILMTTASTILGMVPIALGLGAGSELRSPMAVAIAGGLVTSTLLSLIVVPVFYAVLDDWKQRLFGKRKKI